MSKKVIKNTGDLVDYIAETTGSTKTVASASLKAAVEGILIAVQSGDHRINVKDFGVFRMAHRAARTGINPKTGESIKIEAKNTLAYKPAQKVREHLN